MKSEKSQNKNKNSTIVGDVEAEADSTQIFTAEIVFESNENELNDSFLYFISFRHEIVVDLAEM